ncbi:MAG: inosine triphosphate pyrophosphatase-like protein [Monoraphidium minutum]|nr:MAG: inosine triphosphate pyrophosphatase-like protein [Monoraphidium minutum]
MLLQHVGGLSRARIVLASGSPRRRELLHSIGLKFEVCVSTFDELLPHGEFKRADHYAIETARHKAMDVMHILSLNGKPEDKPVDLIISADTVVETGGRILEKPDDAAHAKLMLKSLCGSKHHVHTGVVLVVPQSGPAAGVPPGAGDSIDEGWLVRAFSCSTEVEFEDLDDGTLDAYVASGEPFGKAGAYAIQGLAGSFVRRIDGCFYNVVGFPVNEFSKQLLRLIDEGHLPLDE